MAAANQEMSELDGRWLVDCGKEGVVVELDESKEEHPRAPVCKALGVGVGVGVGRDCPFLGIFCSHCPTVKMRSGGSGKMVKGTGLCVGCT